MEEASVIGPPIDPARELHVLLEEQYARAMTVRDGAVATYIPELATVDPEHFGLATCTVTGEVVSVGDGETPFTIQSICKPFLYATALAHEGRHAVHRRVGVEPSGDAFNSVIRVESGSNRPHNPMINAGAIVIASLLCAEGAETAVDRVVAEFGRWTGRSDLAIDEAVYQSEAATGDRNRAIAYLMRHLGMLGDPVEGAVDLYFRACSVTVTSRDLAVMAATLASGGRNPCTGEQVVRSDVVRDVLTIMSTCGMYDGTGRFAVDVGMPAKSGVSGGILAVAPGRLGLAVYAPRLDAKGNSVRGVAVLRDASARRSFHLLDPTAPTPEPSPPISVSRLREAFDAAMVATGDVSDGAVASYIPELTAADPTHLALAACSVAGDVVATGDHAVPFTIQAAANPFGYALAIAEHGLDAVGEKVGVEPSGNPYNAIALTPVTRRPYNALNNAGAIAIAGLQPGSSPEDRWSRLSRALAAMAGESVLPLDDAVYRSEQAHGARNRAIAYLLRNFGIVDDVDDAVDRYLRQCSLQVTVSQLAAMGAVLAAGGRQPITGERLLPAEVVQQVLTVMYTCGMHDASGQFAFEVGLPGKSGISGAIVAVVPGRMGMAVYAPRVDARGASVRGFAVLEHLSRALGLGLFTRE
jgi:glutaminase A